MWAEIVMDSDLHPDPSTNNMPIMELFLSDGPGRSNAKEFFANGDEDDLCRVILHEAGHHFGLEDEYEDPNCPDRTFISMELQPYSVMANIWTNSWDQFDFFPRHIETVFGAYCGTTTVKEQEIPDSWINLGPPH